jgi:hypothetical protein
MFMIALFECAVASAMEIYLCSSATSFMLAVIQSFVASQMTFMCKKEALRQFIK